MSVSVLALAVTVISARPLNGTPFMLREVLNFVALFALPVSVAPINVFASIISNLEVPEFAVTLPVTSPARSAVINPALNPPALFLTTTFPIELDDVASTFHVTFALPSKSFPVK